MDLGEAETINLTGNYSRKEVYYRPSDYVLVPTSLVALVAIIADILLIYTIAKYRELQTSVNICILNWSVCNVLFLILSPINFTVLAFLDYISVEIVCVWFGGILVTLTGNSIFAIALVLDWCIRNYSPKAFLAKIRTSYKYVLTFVWCVLIVVAVYICFNCVLSVMHEWIFIVATTSFLFIIVVHVVRLVKLKTSGVIEEEANLVLILASSCFLCWLPNYVVHFIKTFNIEIVIYPEIVVLTYFVGYLNSIIILFLLYHYEKNFKSTLKTLCNYTNESSKMGSFESIDLKSGQVTSLI